MTTSIAASDGLDLIGKLCRVWYNGTPLFVSQPEKNAQVFSGGHLTHWGRGKIDAILQTTFSNAV